MDGVWIEPVTAQVTMTLRGADMQELLVFLYFLIYSNK